MHTGWDVAVIAQHYGRTLTMMRLAYLFSFHHGYGQPALLHHLDTKWRPKHTLYWDAETRQKKNGLLYPRWNLIVPVHLDNGLSDYFSRWHGGP